VLARDAISGIYERELAAIGVQLMGVGEATGSLATACESAGDFAGDRAR
jgi:hypothetical protein